MAVYRLGNHLLVDASVGFMLATPLSELVAGGGVIDALAEIFKVQGCLDCRRSCQDDELLARTLESITIRLGGDANECFQLACYQTDEMDPPPLWPMAEAGAIKYLQDRCLMCDQSCGPLVRAATAAGVRRVLVD